MTKPEWKVNEQEAKDEIWELIIGENWAKDFVVACDYAQKRLLKYLISQPELYSKWHIFHEMLKQLEEDNG